MGIILQCFNKCEQICLLSLYCCYYRRYMTEFIYVEREIEIELHTYKENIFK